MLNSLGRHEMQSIRERIRKSLNETVLFWGLSLLVATHFAISYTVVLTRAFIYFDYASHNVDYPFRSRVMMAWVFRLALHIGGWLHIPPNAKVFFGGSLSYCELICVLVSMFISIWAVRRCIEILLGKQTPYVWGAFLLPLMAYFHFLLIGEIRVQTPYDMPSVMFYALATLAILSRRRWLYYPVFLLATFNRESTLFLPLFFFLAQLREDVSLGEAMKSVRAWVVGETVLQLAVWKGIRMLCDHWVGKGVIAYKEHFPQNIHFLLDPLHWATIASVFGFLWIPYVIYFRDIRSVLLRRWALLTPLWFAVMLGAGDLLEIRINSEWMPYMALCLTLIASRHVVLRGQTPETAEVGELVAG